jgi:hypothetical protein
MHGSRTLLDDYKCCRLLYKLVGYNAKAENGLNYFELFTNDFAFILHGGAF